MLLICGRPASISAKARWSAGSRARIASSEASPRDWSTCRATRSAVSNTLIACSRTMSRVRARRPSASRQWLR